MTRAALWDLAPLTKPLLSRARIPGDEVSLPSGSTRKGCPAARHARARPTATGARRGRASLMRPQSFRATIILGIDGLQRILDAPNGTASADHYPPYNLERISGTDGRGDLLRLIFAVAGFAPEQLEIGVVGDQLSISGEQNGDVDTHQYLYRGIASRRFRRVFRLADISASSARPSKTGCFRSISASAVRVEKSGSSRSGCGTRWSAASRRCLKDRNRQDYDHVRVR